MLEMEGFVFFLLNLQQDIIVTETKSAVDDKHDVASTSTKADQTLKNEFVIYYFKN